MKIYSSSFFELWFKINHFYNFKQFGFKGSLHEEQIDLTSYYFYDYTPYHFKIGLTINKGRYDIEENFLLQDSFTCLVKANNSARTLEKYVIEQEQKLKTENIEEFDKETFSIINLIKYDTAFYSRTSIISFFSFLESLVNSIGFDFYCRNKENLSTKDTEILLGSKKGRFLPLKYKIEKYQKIMRSDKASKIVLSDTNQIKEPFKALFEEYESLRNSSVHFSPIKTRIWLKPHDWLEKALAFSQLVIQASLEIWQCCHETDKGPDYLGRLEYDRLYKMAKDKEIKIKKVKNYL